MRLVFMGTPEFAVAPLRNIVLNGYEVAAVYTKKDKLSGRGQEMSSSAVKREALSLGLTVVQPGSLRKPEALAELASLMPDVIVVAAFGQILPPEVLNLPRFGCINIHPSLLPRHRGAAPVVSTILAGDAWGGVSIMQMDEGLDTGPVLTRAQALVRDDDTTETLSERLSLMSAQMLADILPGWTRGEIKPQPQDDALATYFKPIEKEAGEIKWNLPALELWRQVRAYQPWPGSFTHFNGRVLKILEAWPVACATQTEVGAVVALGKGCGVVTGSGILELRRLQIEGKQAMSAADFIRGQRGFIGTVLPG
ncbi:MAG: methionyl-tRNA formyltransferase [Dehalococcoidia bacterium]|nr:MAG: methionyl-tRNA formyltransferase [Dehalococcoidia bacterium]